MGSVPGGGRALRRAAWASAGLGCGLLAAAHLALAGGVVSRPGVTGTPGAQDLLFYPVVLAFVGSGVALVHLRPRNRIGWLLLGCGLLQGIQLFSEAYGVRALTDPDRTLPLGLLAMWLASWTWLPAVLLPALVLPAVYPTGGPSSRFWLWHVRVSLVGIAAVVLAPATVQGAMDDTVAWARLPWDAPTWWAVVVGILAVGIVVPATVVVVGGTVVRAARAGPPERQQLIWLVSVVGAMIATIFLPVDYVFVLAYAFVPVAVVMGVLRYRLLGIEVVLRRGLLYVPLTLLVALTVGGLTTVVARLAPEGPLPLLVASAVVAVLVIPVAGRLRGLVDRFVLGRRDPMAAVGRVAAGLEVATDDPVPTMLESIASAVGVSCAVVRDTTGAVVATVGESRAEILELPLRHGGEVLGTLAVGPRRGEPRVSDANARLVGALATHLAVVVHSRRLARDLAMERERVVAATLAERDRLRRDLHDGLGPSLSGIALGLEAAEHALIRDPHSAHELLARVREEADSAVREVRRVLDGLRPAVLDQHGLVDAVRATATGLGLGRPGGPCFDLDAGEMPPLAPGVEAAAYRIVAESLTNVVRHSGAARCAVRLGVSGDQLQVIVDDDGKGPDGSGRAGMGLESMRRRAGDLGGCLEIRALRPHGTAVIAVLPLGAP